MITPIEKIASVHLGKAGDGSVVKPYVTPDEIDPSLLVAIPRSLNREQYGIEENKLPFVGIDVWNAYEFSTLLKSGFPYSGLLKISYPVNSPFIVESKSIKLYLNSYNMVRLISKVSEHTAIERRIREDLEKCLQTTVKVSLIHSAVKPNYLVSYQHDDEFPFKGSFTNLDTYCDVENMEFNSYNEDPSLLQVRNSTTFAQRYTTSSLRSNCRVTNQPDWGDVFIHIRGEKTVTPESLLRYIVSMRKENHFHEEICECIYKRLYDLLNPGELFVACLYTRRGGIDINPVRANSVRLLYEVADNLLNTELVCKKTLRQ